MSVPFSGTVCKSGGLTAAFKKQVRLSNLKAAKSITAKFDPWNEKSPAWSAREFMFQIGTREATSKNPDCRLLSKVVSDRSEPAITCELINGETVVIKTANFTTLEVLQLFNKYVSPHGPAITGDSLQTKASKTASRKGK